ncbi:MAG: hypothetical protein JWN14_5147 [Chthonomonadales bacterium]|nr:hypothetical protein [Chthonomonadales bacterium]
MRAVNVLLSLLVFWMGGESLAGAAPPPKPILVLREGLNGSINEWSAPAKFALYRDGTVFTETSNEASEQYSGPLKFLRAHLTAALSQRLLQSLDVSRIVGARKQQFGQGSVTWQVLYWNGSKQGKMTVQGQLDSAPAKVAKLIRSLENYPKRGSTYLGYDYEIRFETPSGDPQRLVSIPWPKTWNSIKFAKGMLSGSQQGVSIYKLDAPHTLQLKAMLTQANSNCVTINGHVWNVKFYPSPRLPNDILWMQKPL